MGTREIHATRFLDLAERPILNFAGPIRYSAISRDADFASGDDGNNSGALSGGLRGMATTQQKDKQASWQWVRQRSTGASVIWMAEKLKAPAFDVAFVDIDVSNDGDDWFHLLGPHCLDGLGDYNGPITREGVTPQAVPATSKRAQ